MAQVTDKTVGANPTGFDMRTELNNIIAALESDNSGSSEPLNPVPYMKWLDTSNATYYYYKERNHDNTAWVTLFRYTVATNVMEAVSNGVVLQDSALVHKTGDETIAGVKTFSSSPLVPSATTGGQAIRYDQSVKLTGDETIAGVKTFNSSPIVPTPTAGDNSTKVATTAFVKAKSEADSIGVGQTWQDVTASRSLGVTYTNTTGKPIQVMITTEFTAQASYVFSATVNGVQISYVSNNYTIPYWCFIVPQGHTYSVTSGIQLSKWSELR